MEVLQLIFWVAVLISWFYAVYKGFAFLERTLDRFLDRWFHSDGSVKRNVCWIDYMN